MIILFEQVLLYTGLSETQKKYYKAILMKDLGKKFLNSLNKIIITIFREEATSALVDFHDITLSWLNWN